GFNSIFTKLEEVKNRVCLSTKFIIMDLEELKKRHWVTKIKYSDTRTPQTIKKKIDKEALEKQQCQRNSARERGERGYVQSAGKGI
ncbi:hypothetical protein PFISCL1PPCAC_11783, partial [Pristionchus fissidentatus]